LAVFSVFEVATPHNVRKIASFIRRQHIKKFFLTGAKGVPIFNELVAALAQSVEQRTENPK